MGLSLTEKKDMSTLLLSITWNIIAPTTDVFASTVKVSLARISLLVSYVSILKLASVDLTLLNASSASASSLFQVALHVSQLYY